MVLAVAFAVVPAVAEETTQGVKRDAIDAPRPVAVPPESTAPAHQAVETLQRLRLHPGQDSLSVEETARRRPHPDGD